MDKSTLFEVIDEMGFNAKREMRGHPKELHIYGDHGHSLK